jgi:hypothetical protein
MRAMAAVEHSTKAAPRGCRRTDARSPLTTARRPLQLPHRMLVSETSLILQTCYEKNDQRSCRTSRLESSTSVVIAMVQDQPVAATRCNSNA